MSDCHVSYTVGKLESSCQELSNGTNKTPIGGGGGEKINILISPVILLFDNVRTCNVQT